VDLQRRIDDDAGSLVKLSIRFESFGVFGVLAVHISAYRAARLVVVGGSRGRRRDYQLCWWPRAKSRRHAGHRGNQRTRISRTKVIRTVISESL
jgi:hypothetical protein